MGFSRLKDHKNRHRQWGKQAPREYDAEIKTVKRVFAGSKQSARTLRSWWGKSREWSLSVSKGKALLLLGLLIVSGVFVADQFLKPEGKASLIFDPTIETKLWEPATSPGDLSEWNVLNGAYAAGAGLGNCGGSMGAGSQCIRLTNNSTFPGIALTKSSSDFSAVSGKAMALFYEWGLGTGYALNKISGMYLTRNGTLPLEASYNPMNDLNVALMYRVYASTSAIWQSILLIQRDPTQTLNQGDTGAGGSFLAGETIDEAVTSDPSIGTIWQMAVMNFTGYTATTATCSTTLAAYGISSPQGCSFVDKDGGRTWPPSNMVTQLPHFQFQAQSYYVGFFVESGSTINTYTFALNTAQAVPITGLSSTPKITISTFTPAQATPPNIDTGGFFGPVLRWFLNGAVWILNGIAQFLGFVANVFVTAMDAAGNFFGLGTIGTSIRSFFTDIGSFIANVFGTVIGWLGTISSLFQNGIGFVTNFFSGSNGFVAWIISWFTGIGGLWAIVQDLWTALNTAVLTMNQILIIYYLAGMFMVYLDGWPGFLDWLKMGTTFTIQVFKIGFFIAKEAWGVLIVLKQLLTGWL